MRVPRSVSLLALLVPGLLATPTLAGTVAPVPRAVHAGVQEISVSGIARTATSSALRTASTTRTVLLTRELDTRSFALVGVTWAPDPAVGSVAAAVRTRTDGAWSSWQPLGGTADEQPDLGSVDAGSRLRAGTSPLWVGEADGVQARVQVLTGAAPTDLRLSLVDPGTSAADAAAAAPVPAGRLTTSAASFTPVVRNRAAWSADESIRRGSPSYYSSIHGVVVHHTASSNDYTEADVPRLLRGFYAYHVRSNGWSDLGYNFVVDKFGRIWEGRAGGTTRPVIGSHAGGFNSGTVGISVIGTYDTVPMSAAAREAVAQIAGWRLGLAGKDPGGTVSIRSGGSTRFASGTTVTLPRIFGHREVSTTACPGALGMSALPGLRTRAKAVASGVAAAPAPPAPLPAPPAPRPPAPTPTLAPPPVALTALGAGTVRRGELVVLSGTARPGARVEVLFRTPQRALGVTARRGRDVPRYAVGRVVAAGPDGRWTTTFPASRTTRWYARSEGTATRIGTTVVR